ncbi:transcription initiation factor IIB [candidate division MSBL1 archaeon SCGC-AAA259I09]|uniref:Transcription initiation factor IIB n=3 Tax=candidate division MSBL1 TaxID=215777 RepID=A0A133UJK5_9EURY|nr:transcription initiation factor IIB [candidate division MSBL1 archaeon SCGC-AAA259I09]KXA95097.1 transcription initiation factor IIB [candidate division MSBL1 archaeon SCGC-AAA259I07]KXA98289.1 transcription initiation factor IIB [candidate division MSBL1 archaeon SCGC-AAA259M10]
MREKTTKKDSGRKKLAKDCPSCEKNSVVRDYKRNIEICDNCGRIVKEDIKDRGPEWRAFDQKQRDEKSRGGPPSTETIHDKGLSTQIDYKNRDAKGNKLSPERRRKVYRLRKWHKRGRVTDSKDRNLAFSLSEINRMSSQLGLSKNVQEIASKIYRKAVERGLIRGRSMEGCASAALYAACREADVPRTLEEVTKASRVDKSEIRKTYRFLSRELDIHLSPTDPVRYVARFGSELGISGETRVKAIEIIRKAQEKKLTSGKSPTGTAAAAIYIAALEVGERKTQRETAEAADVTEVTIRNRYKEMVEELNFQIDA